MNAPPRPGLVESVLRLEELADITVPLSLRAAQDLGIADLLDAGPLPLRELAARSGCHAPSLGRMLRVLAGRGVFREVAPERFALTPLAEALRGDHPLSAAGAYPLLPDEVRAWARLDHTVQTGRPALPSVARSRAALDRRSLVHLLPALDWHALGTIADVGSGSGTFLAGLVARHPGLRAIPCDLPGSAPAGADTYLLRVVLSELDDAAASALLAGVRQMTPPGGRVLVVEAAHDLPSLVMGWPERAAADLERLLAGAAFEPASWSEAGPLSILEGLPAQAGVRRAPVRPARAPASARSRSRRRPTG